MSNGMVCKAGSDAKSASVAEHVCSRAFMRALDREMRSETKRTVR